MGCGNADAHMVQLTLWLFTARFRLLSSTIANALSSGTRTTNSVHGIRGAILNRTAHFLPAHINTGCRLDLAGQQHQMRKFRTGRVHAECSRKLPSELWGLNCGRRSGACHLHTYKSTHSITVRAHSHTPPTARAAHHLPRRGLPLEAAVRALGAELSPSILLSCLYADNHT